MTADHKPVVVWIVLGLVCLAGVFLFALAIFGTRFELKKRGKLQNNPSSAAQVHRDQKEMNDLWFEGIKEMKR